MTEQRDFAAAEALVRDSLIAAIIDSAALAWRRAAAQSSLLSWIGGPVAQYRQASAVDRVRAVAIVVLTAAVVELVLLRFLPRQVAPSVPASFWMLTGAAAAFSVVCARSLAIGWQSSLLRRVGRAVRAWAQPSA